MQQLFESNLTILEDKKAMKFLKISATQIFVYNSESQAKIDFRDPTLVISLDSIKFVEFCKNSENS